MCVCYCTLCFSWSGNCGGIVGFRLSNVIACCRCIVFGLVARLLRYQRYSALDFGAVKLQIRVFKF